MKKEFEALTLTPEYFELLMEQVKDKFLTKNKLSVLPKNYQFFGYGNYNPDLASLKRDLEEISTEFVNGKYLYDKIRLLQIGRPTIKLNTFYTTLLLIYLDYTSSISFIESQEIEHDKKKDQLVLSKQYANSSDLYFLSYYFGEFHTIIKGRTVISQNRKKIHHTFLYRNQDGSIDEIYSDGSITRGRDTIHTRCKTIIDNKLYDGDSEIFYVGQVELSHLNFIIGNYVSFNLHTNTVSGRVILEKCESEADMMQKSSTDTIPAYIAQEIRNSVIETPHSIAKTHLVISKKSPYSSIYAKLPGSYVISFETDEESNPDPLKFKILSTNYKLISQSENVYVEEDKIELLNKGTIIRFRFVLSGVASIDQADIYIKSVFLKNELSGHEGVFSGIDNENRLISGKVSVAFIPVEN